VATQNSDNRSNNLNCVLTVEDEFILTRIRIKAQSLKNKDRDQFFWKTVFKLICRERAYKTVMSEVGIVVDTNMSLFDDDDFKAVQD
jgi:hypothetical protein